MQHERLADDGAPHELHAVNDEGHGTVEGDDVPHRAGLVGGDAHGVVVEVVRAAVVSENLRHSVAKRLVEDEGSRGGGGGGGGVVVAHLSRERRLRLDLRARAALARVERFGGDDVLVASSVAHGLGVEPARHAGVPEKLEALRELLVDAGDDVALVRRVLDHHAEGDALTDGADALVRAGGAHPRHLGEIAGVVGGDAAGGDDGALELVLDGHRAGVALHALVALADVGEKHRHLALLDLAAAVGVGVGVGVGVCVCVGGDRSGGRDVGGGRGRGRGGLGGRVRLVSSLLGGRLVSLRHVAGSGRCGVRGRFVRGGAPRGVRGGNPTMRQLTLLSRGPRFSRPTSSTTSRKNVILVRQCIRSSNPSPAEQQSL